MPQQIQPQIDEIPQKYCCSVCNNSLDGFLPPPKFYEENLKKYGWPFSNDDEETFNTIQYSCPKCGAPDRDRLCALYLDRILDKNPSGTVLTLLDIAPSQPLKSFLRKYANIMYLSADKYLEGTDIVVDITDMNNIRSEFFDIFICSHVLEHVQDDKKALSELYRILRPGGFGVLMVPINLKMSEIDEDPSVEDFGERWRRFGQDDHVRQYSKTGFIERVIGAGFILKQYNIDFFGKDVFGKFGISPKSTLYVVERKRKILTFHFT